MSTTTRCDHRQDNCLEQVPSASTAAYFMNKADERARRSIAEVDRVYDKEFVASLAKIVGYAYTFIETKGNNKLDPKIRFERFWDGADADAEMLVVTSRLEALGQCLEAGECDRQEVFSRFPQSAYQAVFFLRDFVFISHVPPSVQIRSS